MTIFEGRGFSCRSVVERGQPILAVYHDRDGAWQLLCGGDEHTDDSQILVIHPSHLAEKDKTLQQLSDLPLGFTAARISVGAPWNRTEIEADVCDVG